jgi:hypothetical protein
MDRKQRAAAALKLLQYAIEEDDQSCFDLLVDVVGTERLYLECSTDAGEPCNDLETFVRDLGVDDERAPTGLMVLASARGGQSLEAKLSELDHAIVSMRRQATKA